MHFYRGLPLRLSLFDFIVSLFGEGITRSVSSGNKGKRATKG